jgi:hypothetical protein
LLLGLCRTSRHIVHFRVAPWLLTVIICCLGVVAEQILPA